MKLGIIGLPRSGKATVFEALTKRKDGVGAKNEDRIATINVPDRRVGNLNHIYNLPKTIYAQVEYFLPGIKKGGSGEQAPWTAARDCDALIHIIRNHAGFGFEDQRPFDDFHKLDQELMLHDLVVVEKRLDRIEIDHKRGKKMNPEEHALLTECHHSLENEVPLRRLEKLTSAVILRGYGLLSSKPMLLLFNNGDDDEKMPQAGELAVEENCMVIRGKLEQELSQMTAEDADEFLAEFNIAASAMDRVIKRSYALLDLISFFTIGKKEIRAWTIKRRTSAHDAAEVVHSDMKRGFIRAEVVSYEDLIASGSYAEAKKAGTVRLEGKGYEVQDGDIITFRFNV
jgi:GTP-binding protein YchF